MKKKKLYKALQSFIFLKLPTYPTKKHVKREIRAIADNYEEFHDMVFELGCELLAKEYLKKEGEKTMNSPDLNDADVEMIRRLKMAGLAIELSNGRITKMVAEEPTIQVMSFMRETNRKG